MIPVMTEPLTTFILAGGRSSRMGRDKATIKVGARTMLEHACSLAADVGSDRILVLGRPDHALGVADDRPYEGPAKALAAQLAHLSIPARILVLPVDMPFLKPLHINVLLAQKHGCHFERQYLPFAARVKESIAFDGDRVRDLLAALGVTSIQGDPGWGSALQNINTPDALGGLDGQ